MRGSNASFRSANVDHDNGVPGRMVSEAFPVPTFEGQSARGSVPDFQLSDQGESAGSSTTCIVGQNM